MITLSMEIGINPIINHRPVSIFKHLNSSLHFSIGEYGEIVSWDFENNPIY
jgi:hypothetical protein